MLSSQSLFFQKFKPVFLMSLFGPCTHVQMTIDYMSGVNSKFMERYGFPSPTVWPHTCILLTFTFMYKDVESFFFTLLISLISENCQLELYLWNQDFLGNQSSFEVFCAASYRHHNAVCVKKKLQRLFAHLLVYHTHHNTVPVEKLQRHYVQHVAYHF